MPVTVEWRFVNRPIYPTQVFTGGRTDELKKRERERERNRNLNSYLNTSVDLFGVRLKYNKAESQSTPNKVGGCEMIPSRHIMKIYYKVAAGSHTHTRINVRGNAHDGGVQIFVWKDTRILKLLVYIYVIICIYVHSERSCCRFELFTLLLCGFRPFFFHLFIFCMFVFFFPSRLTTHYTSEYEIHVDKRRCGIHGLWGDRRPTNTHNVDQRIRATELQERQSQVTNLLS